MSGRKKVRVGETQAQDRAGAETAVPRSEPAREDGPGGEGAHENDVEDNSSQVERPRKKQSHVKVLGSDKSLKSNQRSRRDRRYERGLIWRHGDNQSLVRILGALWALVFILTYVISLLRNPRRLPFVDLIREPMILREAGRRCLTGEGVRGAGDIGHCSFEVDGSVVTGVALAGALFSIQCAIIAIIGFRSYVAVRRTGRHETVAASIFSSFKASLVFWGVMCDIWLSISYVCLVWLPDLPTLWEQFPLSLVAVMPLWGFEIGSAVLPTLLCWHIVDYGQEDVTARRNRIADEYGCIYSCACRAMKEKDVPVFVQKCGESRRVAPWLVSGVALLVLTVLSLRLSVARSFGVLSCVALFDTTCVIFFVYAVGLVQVRSPLACADKASIFIAGIVSPLLLTLTVFSTEGSSFHLGPLVFRVLWFVALLGMWMFVMMQGFYGMLHPIRTIRARRLLLLSDELVWLSREKVKVEGRGDGDSLADTACREPDSCLSMAPEPLEGQRGPSVGEREFRRTSKRWCRSSPCHRGMMVGLGGALLILRAARSKSSRVKLSRGE